ncbi:DUF421 domain-containing protein [Pontibacillus yanchengensis]|uniref:DUF421 domain-containing protein n=2 Tax=Pontibacillus yanchengensis TaxID=462910 RepID=A0A6I5A313_9BACI|nr:DUF421 domain-containing protein [Pontibacillus yanchengensis]MYL33341.1 DUF421 domain-containing protein [Pontibacillus yanchengensis]MYL53390.1 DUF421 domain-containing protein [Pontibacillus yanchengensis]
MFIVIGRTFATYLVILIIFRLMGKREIGELSILDLVVFVMLAEIGVFSIEDPQDEFIHAIIPMIVLLFIQRGTAWLSLKSQMFRVLLDGKPSVIIREGKINEHEMRKQRYNFDDLMQQLRENGTRSVADVDFAVLEPSGKLSIYEKSEKRPNDSSGFIMPLIADGKIQYENLKQNHKDEDWLRKEIHKRGYENPEQISFLSVDQENKWYIDTYEAKKKD